MIPTSLKNSRGVTLIEMMVGMAIGLAMMSVAIYTFTHHQSILRDQNADAAIRGQGRLAVNKIAKDIRNAGAGIPVNLKFETATSSVFKYKVNPNDGPTPITAGVLTGDVLWPLTTVTNFSTGQKVVVYILGEMYNLVPTKPTITGGITAVDTAAKTISLSDTSPADYSEYITVVNPYDTITYTHDSVNNRIVRNVNGTDYPFISDVTGLTFAYKDRTGADLGNPVSAANRPNIRKVEVTLSFQNPTVANAHVDFQTDVFIRNTDDGD